MSENSKLTEQELQAALVRFIRFDHDWDVRREAIRSESERSMNLLWAERSSFFQAALGGKDSQENRELLGAELRKRSAKVTCDVCDGNGEREVGTLVGDVPMDVVVKCIHCEGTGVI